MSDVIVDFKKRQQEKQEKQEKENKEEAEKERERIKQMIEFPVVTLSGSNMIVAVNSDGKTYTLRDGNRNGMILKENLEMSPMEKLLLQNIVMIEIKTLSVLEAYCPEIINWGVPPSHSINIDAMHELREKKEKQKDELPPTPEPS